MITAAQRRLLTLSSLGGVLEFYDFIIYALLAEHISTAFFPTGNDITSLMLTFATFSVGYLVRPIGGILFGHFGDRHGRKTTFSFSILMMAISTFAIGLIPTHASIGIIAPILVLFFRICQGLSVGGEIPGAIAYVSESMPNIKGLACGIIFFALINGIVLGSLMKAILVSSLSEPQMASWGWRLPFFIGGTFGFLGYWLRRQLQESALFQQIAHKRESFPIVKVFQQAGKNAIAGVFIVGLGAGIITLLFLFMPAYISKLLHITSHDYIWYNTLAIFASATMIIGFGWLADRHSRKTLLIIACLLTILAAYPIFTIYTQAFSYFGISLAISATIMGLVWGTIPSLLAQLFPTEFRYSGIAVSYNIGFAVFGGLTPLIAIVLIERLHSITAPIYYLFVVSILALVGLFLVHPKEM